MKFSPNMTDAVKVQFLKQIFEDDFPERGMKAYLTGVEIENRYSDDNDTVYTLFFDFSEFEKENMKYFKEVYYPNICTEGLENKPLYTAIEAGIYKAKYSVYIDVFDDQDFHEVLSEYLKILEG